MGSLDCSVLQPGRQIIKEEENIIQKIQT